jgi:peptidoglycan hydrolase-like protein with peptidoglycan-binding domain
MRRFVLVAVGAAIAVAPAGVATAGASAATAGSAAVRAPATTNWPVVRPGARGERVRVIQGLLNQRGRRVTVDGTFGNATTTAVKGFQRANHLAVDGHVGPATWTKLVLTLRQGSRGAAVTALQHQLRFQYRYQSVQVDGTFGAKTKTAVTSFQRVRHLAADGVVGTATWKALEA